MTAFSVIIPAAGHGARSGSEMPKQYVSLGDRTAIAYAVRAFLDIEECVEVIVAVDRSWRDRARTLIDDDARVRFVDGGALRQHSVAIALVSVTMDSSIVVVHDAARPCVRRSLISRVVEAARDFGAAIPVLRVADTVKRVDDNGFVIETMLRDQLRLAQTPQAFRRELLEQVYAHALTNDIVGTDDSSLVEAFGISVHTVDGDSDNIKITLAEDFARAEAILRAKPTT